MSSINLGGIERSKDVRDVSLEKVSDVLGMANDIPETYTPNLKAIIQNWQKNWPACGSHSGSHVIEAFEYFESGESVRISPAYIWKRIKQIDGHKPEVGTDMRSILKVLSKWGGCRYDLLPNDYDESLAEYTNPSVITPDIDEDAQPRIIRDDYGFGTDLSFEGIKRAIYNFKAVILLIHCDSGFFNTSKPSFTEKKYGHFVVALGYDKDNIIIIDSTEEDFPIKKINKKYLSFIREAGTPVDLQNDYVRELVKKRNLMQKLISLYQQLKKLIK